MTDDGMATEVLALVQTLNSELEVQDYVEAKFSMETDGERTRVRFWAYGLGDGVVLWDSVDEEPGWRDPDEEEPLPLERRLRADAMETLDNAAEQARRVKL